MTWTYMTPRASTISGSISATSFTVQTGAGSLFIPGPSVVSNQECAILLISGDTVTLTNPLPFIPAIGDSVSQSVLDDKDKVRFFCGDTDSEDPQLQDEEITTILLLRRSILRAASMACMAIAAKLARKVTYQIYQEIQERLTEQQKNYLDLSKQLDRQAARQSSIPAFPALLETNRMIAIADTTKIAPFFARDMFTEPGTEGTSVDADTELIQPYY